MSPGDPHHQPLDVRETTDGSQNQRSEVTSGDASSTDSMSSLTGLAPTFARPAENPRGVRPHPPAAVKTLEDGSRIDDFEILRVLGQGAFGVVYLATQVSLNRRVALKVTPNMGSEGRTLAQLEHENIVRVFAECVSAEGAQRLLCMQYIPGITLETVIQVMHGQKKNTWGGATVLELIDDLNPDPPVFHPAGLRDRQQLADSDWIEAICWIGAQLAEALAYAHDRGVLHRDIKPANILQSQYGTPFLADFNLAFQPVDLSTGDSALFGGTLAYMSPEHLEAFHPNRPTKSESVDERSDIYSLGVVLYELACGHWGLPDGPAGLNNIQKLEQIARARRQLPPRLPQDGSAVLRVFDRTIRRCLDPVAQQRPQKAADLARSLNGCRDLRLVEKELPTPGIITRSALRHPFFWLVLLGVLPHLPIGSTVNIAYNMWQIVNRLSPDQKHLFNLLVVGYNVSLYPIYGFLVWRLVSPIFRVWRSLDDDGWPIDNQPIDAARRATTRLPLWSVILACLGWLPVGIGFPLALHLFAGPAAPWVFVHFLISCTLSGLIAMTYSYIAIQYLATRVFYPQLWSKVDDLAETAKDELQQVPRRLSWVQSLAGLIPLLGAILVVLIGPEEGSNSGAFRFLVVTLIVLGFSGFQLANVGGSLILQTIGAMTKSRVSSYVVGCDEGACDRRHTREPAGRREGV